MNAIPFLKYTWLPLVVMLALVACDSNSNEDEEDPVSELAAAFAEFDTDNVTIMLDGDQVLIESNGLPNHTSPLLVQYDGPVSGRPHGQRDHYTGCSRESPALCRANDHYV